MVEKKSKNEIVETEAKAKAEELRQDRRKAGKKRLVELLAIVVGIVIICLGRVLIKSVLSEKISQDTAYQIGNYVQGGVYGDGDLYFTNYDRGINEAYEVEAHTLYKLDSQGTLHELWRLDEALFFKINNSIYYYNGWIYLLVYDDNGMIVRINQDGTAYEILVENKDLRAFGIREGKLYYLVYDINKDGAEVYSYNIDKDPYGESKKLEKNIKQNKYYAYDYPSGLLVNVVYGWDEEELMIPYDTYYPMEYKGQDSHGDSTYDTRQYSGNDIYNLMYTEEQYNQGDVDYDINRVESTPKHLVRGYLKEKYEGKAPGNMAKWNYYDIDDEVTCFNIFDGKIYYTRAAEGNCEVWCADLQGGGKKKICVIDEDYDIWGKKLFVAADNITCLTGIPESNSIAGINVYDMETDEIISYDVCDPTEELGEIEDEKAKLTYSTGVIRDNINALEDGKDIVSFGGYDIGDAEKSSLQDAIDKITEDGYEVAFLAIDLYTGKGIAYNPEQKIFGASTIKGPYVASLAKERDSIMETFGKEMEEAVTISNNFAYATLREQYGSTYIREITDEMGISPEVATSNFPMMTVKELALLWDWNFRYFKNDLNSEKVEHVKKWYENPEHSFIHGTLDEKYTTYTKPGWQSGAETGSNVTNDAGIVMAGERPYIIVVLSTIPDDVSYMTELVRAIDLAHDELVGELTDEIVDED